jgi:iron-sulfur cluster repair protein YtfE (RIC family)
MVITRKKTTRRKKIFNQIKKELETHVRIEETVFYPAMEKHEELKDMVLESTHHFCGRARNLQSLNEVRCEGLGPGLAPGFLIRRT